MSIQKVMPEQQKIDETIETSKRLDKKKLSKIEQSATSLEIDQNQAASEIGAEDEKISILEEQDKDEKGDQIDNN
ncbi:MAG TPA: hypothetical protein VJU13_03020 [Candidatus Nitrosocosmicus sp.]|nr:hypothetical protein [Candidatus Nitrosocosmicus sp.]